MLIRTWRGEDHAIVSKIIYYIHCRQGLRCNKTSYKAQSLSVLSTEYCLHNIQLNLSGRHHSLLMDKNYPACPYQSHFWFKTIMNIFCPTVILGHLELFVKGLALKSFIIPEIIGYFTNFLKIAIWWLFKTITNPYNEFATWIIIYIVLYEYNNKLRPICWRMWRNFHKNPINRDANYLQIIVSYSQHSTVAPPEGGRGRRRAW